MAKGAEQLAETMWKAARTQEQCVRRVPDDVVASEVRSRVRRLAGEDGIKIRTARLGDSVVVVRLDAEVWRQDAATMRQKLTTEH